MSAEILLKDINFIHQTLQTRLDNVTGFSDLLLFVQKLFTFDQLKHLLKRSLNERYARKDEVQSKSSLRSLFISLHQFNGIPSDTLQAHIFSFLPNSEYAKLPLISRNFARIMHQHPFLFNQKRYTLSFKPLCGSDRLLPGAPEPQLNIQVFHRKWKPAVHVVVKVNKVEKDPQRDDGDADDNGNDIYNTNVPWFKFHHWEFTLPFPHENTRARVFLAPNQAIFQCMQKYNSSIHALTIRGWAFKDIIELIFNNQRTFAKCVCLDVHPNLRTLDEELPDCTHLRSVLPNIQCFRTLVSCKQDCRFAQQVMHSFGETLQCIEIQCDLSYSTAPAVTIQIPRDTQWLDVEARGGLNRVTVDLTQCTNLIGVRICGYLQNVLWPISARSIPFLYHGQRQLSCVQKHLCRGNVCRYDQPDPIDIFSMIESKQINAQFVYCSRQEYGPARKKNTSPVTIQQFVDNAAKDEAKCIELSRCKRRKRVFHELLNYCFGDEGVRRNALQAYQKWWILGHGEWMQGIHVYNYDPGTYESDSRSESDSDSSSDPTHPSAS